LSGPAHAVIVPDTTHRRSWDDAERWLAEQVSTALLDPAQ
jgi:hypothetical protein